MEQSEKVRLSSEFFFTKLIIIVSLGFLFLLLTDYRRTTSSRLIEYSISFIVLSLLLLYLFSIPGIYYDNDNLYIKRANKINTVIPLFSIQSMYFSVLGFGQGSYSYKIKYLNDTNEINQSEFF